MSRDRTPVPWIPLGGFPILLLLAVCTPRSAIVQAGTGEPRETPVSFDGDVRAPETAAGQVPAGGPPPSISDSPMPEPSPDPRRLPTAEERTRGTADLRRGVQARAARDWRLSRVNFAAAASSLPLIDDWAHLLAADALARMGDTAAVALSLATADTLRAREWGWRVQETALLTVGDTVRAVRALEDAAASVSGANRRAEVFHRLGELQRRRGNQAAAVSAYRQAMEVAPASAAARESAVAMAALTRSPADRLLEGRVWLRHGNVDRGIAGLDAYVTSGNPGASLQAEVRLEAGRALFNARRYRDAESRLLAAAREPTASPAVAAQALFFAGRSQFRDGRTDLARTTLRTTADRFPSEVAAAQALFILGDLEQDAGRTAAARDYYRRAAHARPAAADATIAAVRYAGILLLAGDPGTAASFLDELEGRRSQDRNSAQILYWSGRAHEAAGRSEIARLRFQRARDIDPVSYYGQLSAQRLGSSLADIPLVDSPRDSERTIQAVDAALMRVDIMRDAGLADLATLEMELARLELERYPGAIYRVAEAHHARAAPVAGILLGREIQRTEGSWNPRLLRIVFPFPHRELIEAEARRHGLDPFMVAGLIRQESMFNPVAVSPAGAVGLMQVMPATGRSLAPRAGITRFDPAMLRRPEVNVRLGTLFLADQLRRAGNRTEAFAAYNAGPTRAARWRQFPEYRDEELFAERIPILETRDYVKIVDFNARLYRMLYGG
jgi:soluble lytic murein transglycosylase